VTQVTAPPCPGPAPGPDFRESRYLGLRHPSGAITGWSALTTGLPAALGLPRLHRRVAADLAALQDQPAALLARSTLHGFIDVICAVRAPGTVILADARVYPTMRLAVAAAGMSCEFFRHHDAADLTERLRRQGPRARPLVLTDGVCPACGRVAPLAAYRHAAAARGGLLAIDDTQGLGLLGAAPDPVMPYGHGGGGSLRWAGIGGGHTLSVSSLAKGFGAPLAVVAGDARLVSLVARNGPLQVHASPASAADVGAAEAALHINTQAGEQLRARLLRLVRRLRRGLARLGMPLAAASCLPVQSVGPLPRALALRLADRLARCGIRTVLQRPEAGPGLLLTWVITARHRDGDIARALAVLATVLGRALPAVRREVAYAAPG
jgi:8-amino-7-oxononanoate synthase